MTHLQTRLVPTTMRHIAASAGWAVAKSMVAARALAPSRASNFFFIGTLLELLFPGLAFCTTRAGTTKPGVAVIGAGKPAASTRSRRQIPLDRTIIAGERRQRLLVDFRP